MIAFTSSDNVIVMIEKHKRRRYIDDTDKDTACNQIIQLLKEKNVRATTANILRCGLGAQTLYAYKIRTGTLRFKRQKKDESSVSK
jgi:hypothetical protein